MTWTSPKDRGVWGLFNIRVTEQEDEDWSVEYSIESPVDRPIRGKLGVYYYNFDREFIQRSITGPFAVFDLVPGTRFGDPRLESTTNQSVFGSLSFDLADNWTLDLEARYAKDEKDITSGQLSAVAVLNDQPDGFDDDFSVYSAPVSDSLSFTSFTPRITLSWQYNDDINFYFLTAKGNKPGGFNVEYFRSDVPAEWTVFQQTCDEGDSINVPPSAYDCDLFVQENITYSEEQQWTYEVGIKSTWLDRRIIANASFFIIDWDNQGLFTTTPVPQLGTGGLTSTTILTNAGKTEIYGMELETNYLISENLSAFLNYGLNVAEFTEGFDQFLEDLTGNGDLKGQEPGSTPNHSVVMGFEATAQVAASTDAFLRGDYLFESKKWTDVANNSYLGDTHTLNFRAGFQSDRWTLSFYVRNLLEEDTPLAVTSFVDLGGFADVPEGTTFGDGVTPQFFGLNPRRGRDAGVEFQWRFGG